MHSRSARLCRAGERTTPRHDANKHIAGPKTKRKKKSQTQIVTFVIFLTLPGQQADNALGSDPARTIAQRRPPQPGRKLTKLKDLN